MPIVKEDAVRARAVAAKLHNAANKLEEIRDALKDVEILLADELFEQTRVHEAAEVQKIRSAISFLSWPTRQRAFEWDSYASARVHY